MWFKGRAELAVVQQDYTLPTFPLEWQLLDQMCNQIFQVGELEIVGCMVIEAGTPKSDSDSVKNFLCHLTDQEADLRAS